jgi:hypothetical protein
VINIDGRDEFVQVRLLLNVSDIPATRKASGQVSHNHGRHPCNYCDVTQADIQNGLAYDMDLPLKAPASELLQAAYRHGIRHDGTRQEKKYGVRYSEIIRLVGFEHAASNPVDPMHNSFLGIVKAFVDTLAHGKKVLRKGREIDRFVDVLTKAVMPGHLGRIPESVGERYKGPKKTRGLPIPLQAEAEDGKGGMVLKAEHWKRILQMLPVALYYAW